MSLCAAPRSPFRSIQRQGVASPAASPGSCPRALTVAGASLRQCVSAPAAESTVETSNIVRAPTRDHEGLTQGQRRKMELQQQAALALEQENSWWRAECSPNLVTATTPAAYKRLITEAPPNQLVVVDYLKPGCSGCRRLFPKLQQIAAQNPDALFIKVNVELAAMHDLAQGMQVSQLPWFHLFRAGDLVASFSANLSTVSTLRAEVAAQKACVDPGCDMY